MKKSHVLSSTFFSFLFLFSCTSEYIVGDDPQIDPTKSTYVSKLEHIFVYDTALYTKYSFWVVSPRINYNSNWEIYCVRCGEKPNIHNRLLKWYEKPEYHTTLSESCGEAEPGDLVLFFLDGYNEYSPVPANDTLVLKKAKN